MLRWLSSFRRSTPRRPATIGGQGEALAAEHLRRRDYRILDTNLTCRFGEIDILAIAPDGKTVVVVEVKAVAQRNPKLPPEVHVNAAKQKKLITLAVHFTRKRKLTGRPIRFDIIAIEGPQTDKPILRHHKGAFEARI